MSRFLELTTKTVPLGACECPGTPHGDGDSAEIYNVLGWDDLVDIGLASSEGAGRRILVTRAIASWTLLEQRADGKVGPVPVAEATVRLLGQETMDAIAEAANEAYEKGRTPVPNASGAPSADSSSESASQPQPTTPKPTTST